MVIMDDNGASVISMLLLRRYDMRYHGVIAPSAYIYGAATARNQQGRGYMSRLICDSLREAYRRGDIFAALQPARRRLYGFYDRFGFATTFYIREERYTSKHRFTHDASQYIIETSGHDPAELAAAYQRLTAGREANILHTENDFKTILIDNDIDGGCAVTARSVSSGDILAIALAVGSYDDVAVRELAAADDDAAAAVLDAVTGKFPGRTIVVEAYPGGVPAAELSARGMARIVNVKAFLELMAAIAPRPINQTIRITDSIIADNNAVFTVTGGNVTRLPYNTPDIGINLDVDISVLTAIVFSTSRMGEIFSLPTARTFMSMMLS